MHNSEIWEATQSGKIACTQLSSLTNVPSCIVNIMIKAPRTLENTDSVQIT